MEDGFIFFCIRILIIIIESESGNKSNVTYNWGPQKVIRDAADLQKKVREVKSLGTSDLYKEQLCLYVRTMLQTLRDYWTHKHQTWYN